MDPPNIRALKRREEELAHNAQNTKDTRSAVHRAEWMERQTVKKYNPADIAAEKKQEEEELRLLSEQLVTAQRERLRQLYEQEFQEWEERLREKGLTIERALD